MNKPETPALADNAPLVSMLQEFISAPERRFAYHEYDRGAEARRFGYRPFASSDRKAFIVTADEAAIELGSPRHQSLAALLWTANDDLTAGGVWTSGTDLLDIREPHACLMLAVMARIKPGFDAGDARFRAILNLSNRIPGYMARSVPGKLWIRISRDLIKRGFSSESLGQCLVHSFHDAFPEIGPVAAAVAAGNTGLVREFTPIHVLERAYSGKNRKLSLDASGALECADLSCASCDEKPSCDAIREIVAIKKSKQGNERA